MSHINEKIDFTSIALIVFEKKALLIFHKKYNIWLPVGGHIELDEDPEEALLREIKEECGLEVEIIAKKSNFESEGVKSLPVPDFMDIHKISDTHSHVGLGYYAKSKSDKFIFNEDEHNDIKWFSEEELEDKKYNIKPDVLFYAKEAIKNIN